MNAPDCKEARHTLEALANALARNINEIALLEHLRQTELLSNLEAFNVFELHPHNHVRIDIHVALLRTCKGACASSAWICTLYSLRFLYAGRPDFLR